ncbi:hypothetical protein AC578_5234 [Pseudocercospora eumusae]|uniref:Uncharacterized protein n=1 Tax=Pseudocercospora eumusae TaxID=321146 RepID=A0A139HDU7_9PEZI|nr:hypothetical protein AC578_5234 [Pseudocercospora eumusae]
MQFTSFIVALAAIGSSVLAAPVQDEVESPHLAPRAVNHVDQVNQINQVLQSAGVQITHEAHQVSFCVAGTCYYNYRTLLFDGCSSYGVLGYCGDGVQFDWPTLYNNYPHFLDYDYFDNYCNYPLYVNCEFY